MYLSLSLFPSFSSPLNPSPDQNDGLDVVGKGSSSSSAIELILHTHTHTHTHREQKIEALHQQHQSFWSRVASYLVYTRTYYSVSAGKSWLCKGVALCSFFPSPVSLVFISFCFSVFWLSLYVLILDIFLSLATYLFPSFYLFFLLFDGHSWRKDRLNSARCSLIYPVYTIPWTE